MGEGTGGCASMMTTSGGGVPMGAEGDGGDQARGDGDNADRVAGQGCPTDVDAIDMSIAACLAGDAAASSDTRRAWMLTTATAAAARQLLLCAPTAHDGRGADPHDESRTAVLLEYLKRLDMTILLSLEHDTPEDDVDAAAAMAGAVHNEVVRRGRAPRRASTPGAVPPRGGVVRPDDVGARMFPEQIGVLDDAAAVRASGQGGLTRDTSDTTTKVAEGSAQQTPPEQESTVDEPPAKRQKRAAMDGGGGGWASEGRGDVKEVSSTSIGAPAHSSTRPPDACVQGDFAPLDYVRTRVDWPAMASWSWGYLHARAGARTIPVEVGATMADATTVYTTLGDYLAALRGGRRDVYLAQHKLTRQVAELRGDVGDGAALGEGGIDVEQAATDNAGGGGSEARGVRACGGARSDGDGGRDRVYPNIFLGPVGSHTPLHTDPADNVFVQVTGVKYLRMYPPAPVTPATLAAARADPHARYTVDRLHAGLEVALPDLTAGRAGIVAAGQAVRIPEGWFHMLTALTAGVSAAYWSA